MGSNDVVLHVEYKLLVMILELLLARSIDWINCLV